MLTQSNRTKILILFLNSPLEKFQLREISRLTKISTPSVNNYLKQLKQENIIIKSVPKSNYPQYEANRDSNYFKQLKITHTLTLLQDLATHIDDFSQPDCIILFGSASRGEDIKSSDLDIYIKSSEKPEDLRKFETKLNKKINILLEEDFNKLSSELKNNLVNGILLKGYLDIWD